MWVTSFSSSQFTGYGTANLNKFVFLSQFSGTYQDAILHVSI